MDRNRKVYGYIRVSTGKQADSGLSLEAQLTKIKAQCAVSDVFIDEIISDAGHSAKNVSRPGMERLIKLVEENKVEAVIIKKIDRLTRSVRDLNYLIELFNKHKTRLISVEDSLDTTSATGRLMINLIGSISQWERDVISERTCDALDAKRARGEKTGGAVPFGYLVDDAGKLMPEPHEQIVLDIIRKMREENQSYYMIALKLNQGGYRTKTGLLWSMQTVYGVMRSEQRRIKSRENC